MGDPTGKVLKVVKPLNGIPKSGLHWYPTYMEQHTRNLAMSRSRADHCPLYQLGDGGLEGMIILRVDDSVIAEMLRFLKSEDIESKSFLSKRRKPGNSKRPFFSGLDISCNRSGEAFIRQQLKIKALTVPMTEREFIRS